MRLLFVASVALLVVSGTANAAKIPGAAFFKLSRVHVQPARSALLFDVAVTDVPPNDRPTLEWSIAPVGGSACDNASYGPGTLSRHGLVVWDEQGPTFRWSFKSDRCTGKVAVVAENQYEHCTATVVVSAGSTKSAAPACAIGGYAIGFSTLPVPAGVFEAYGTVRAELTTKPRSAAAVAGAIGRALRAQTAAFAEFPPVWFCTFTKVFTPIEALRVDLERGASTSADAAAVQQALAKCAPGAVRSAFARVAASPSSAGLDAALARGFPTLFGLRFADLVDRVAAETVALDAARAAAAAGHLDVASKQLEIAGTSATTVGSELDGYQRGVERVENAHG
ncbi:MAG: hypothetical protein JO064_02340 [Actinobacteria bacterium]|nr:hypothetical protein [Actinomycetota bacterium]